jgi:predicted transcriptional regulator
VTTKRKNSLPSIAEQRERRKQFRVALALAGRTQDWFADQARVNPSSLSLVLSGRRVSAPLTAKIDSFIQKHARREAAQNVA